jgi:hypothetical protein
MPVSKATTAWAVSGALGVTSFALGVAAIGPTDAASAALDPRPAITLGARTTSTTAAPTTAPDRPQAAAPGEAGADKPASPRASATMVSPPSPVSARSPD